MIFPDQPHIEPVVQGLITAVEQGRPYPHFLVCIGATPQEQSAFFVRTDTMDICSHWVMDRDEIDPDFLPRDPAELLVLEFRPPPAQPSSLVEPFLAACARADLAGALAVAEHLGDPTQILDDCIGAMAERIRTEGSSAPRGLAPAIRALFEVRYRLAVTDLPTRAALPVVLAEVIHLIGAVPGRAASPATAEEAIATTRAVANAGVSAQEALAALRTSTGVTQS